MIQLSRIISNRLIGSAILGSAVLIGSQNIQAENKGNTKVVKNLGEGAKSNFEESFKTNINYLLTNEPNQQTIGLENLYKLQEQVQIANSGLSVRPLSVEDIKRICSEFFNDKLQKVEQPSEALIKGSFVLLEISGNEHNNHKKFIEWLSTQAEKSVNDRTETSKNKQKVLEAAIRNEFYTVGKTSNNLELSKFLITSYTKLIRENNSDSEFLGNGVRIYEHLKAYRNKEIKDNAIGLFDTVIDALPKLSINEQKELKAQILMLPKNHNFQSDDQAEQGRFVERLSKIFCKNKDADIDGFTQLTDSFLQRMPYFGSSQIVTKWHPYTFYKLMDDSKEYFEENINHLIKEVKNPKDEKARINTRDVLLQTYTTFQYVPRIKELCGVFIFIDPTLVHPDTIDELGTKVTNWHSSKLERPMFKSILECLENETVKKASTSKGIRYIQKDNWMKLNGQLGKIVIVNPDLKGEIRELLIKRLENENDPYNREMIYKTINDVIYNASHLEDEKQKLPDLLKKGIREESAYGAGLIGELISRERNYYSFLGALKDYKTIENLKANELSPLDKIRLDLIGIVNGNGELYKTYLPGNYPPKAAEDGKINKDDLDALLKLRENAFHALSSSNLSARKLSPISYDIITSSLISFLENRFERIGTRETLPGTWGKQSAALIDLYLDHPNSNNKDFIDSKFSFLKGRLFDGIEKVHEVEIEEKKEKKTYTTISLFNKIVESEFIQLNPDENRKIIDELYKQKSTQKEIRERIFTEVPKLNATYNKMRETFALNLLTALCERDHRQFDEYLTYLQRLEFREEEIKRVVEAFIAQ